MRNFNEDYSLVRFLHANPYGDEVDIYVNSMSFYNDLNFREFTPYVYLPKGKHTIEIFYEGTKDNALLNESIEINSDELLTIAIIVNNGHLELLVINEDKEIANGRDSKVRFIQLVPNSTNVNFKIGEDELFSNIAHTDITNYELLSPDNYILNIESVKNKKIIRNMRIKISPNRIYTFYAIGEFPNFEILQSLDGASFLI